MRSGLLSLFCLVWLGAGPAWAADFEFVVIGDTRPTFESENFHRFAALIPKINAVKPDLVINLGDLIYGYTPLSKEKQWDKYQQTVAAIQAPYYQLPGNHDTHSRLARRSYQRRFGTFYQAFERHDCLFVLLDNTEQGRWGYLGPAQFDWLKRQLEQTQARAVFIFMHFPVWEPERVTPEYYQFWVEQLHPLFKQSRVRAVFGGHYHSYGPTREFDGIRYFITGGGGAELRPEYSQAGGDFHFMRVLVRGETCEARVVTGRGEISDAEADVMGGLQFAERHTSRIGIKATAQELACGVEFSVTINNPYAAPLVGKAEWVLDAQAFSVEPATCSVAVQPAGIQQHKFILKALAPTATLQSLPRLEFLVAAGAKHHRFHREVRLLDQLTTPYCAQAPCLDGDLSDWPATPFFHLYAATEPSALLRCAYDRENLYVGLSLPKGRNPEAQEYGFPDDLQLGLARRLGKADFGPDFLRLGFNTSSSEPQNRTPGHSVPAVVPGVRYASASDGNSYEISIPLRLLKHAQRGAEHQLVLNVAFPLPEPAGASDPAPNTFAHRVRYGVDTLVPVRFVELDLQPNR